MHMSVRDQRAANVLGASALALTDAILGGLEEEAGIASGEAAALVSIATRDGGSIADLREALALSHPGTVRLVDRLEAAGLAERRPGPDGRRVALVLTAPGRAAHDRLLAARDRALEVALEPLEASERDVLLPLLEKLLVGMSPAHRGRSYRICRLCHVSPCRTGLGCPTDPDAAGFQALRRALGAS